jgi:hypothetical protein
MPPSRSSTRETLLYELALEWAYRVPYATLVDEARRTGVCSELDLLHLGYRLFLDAARLYRGEISDIVLPARLLARGEHVPQDWR